MELMATDTAHRLAWAGEHGGGLPADVAERVGATLMASAMESAAAEAAQPPRPEQQ